MCGLAILILVPRRNSDSSALFSPSGGREGRVSPGPHRTRSLTPRSSAAAAELARLARAGSFTAGQAPRACWGRAQLELQLLRVSAVIFQYLFLYLNKVAAASRDGRVGCGEKQRGGGGGQRARV